MLYRVLCACVVLALAGTVKAQTLVEKKDGVAPRPPQVGDNDPQFNHNIFNDINKSKWITMPSMEKPLFFVKVVTYTNRF